METAPLTAKPAHAAAIERRRHRRVGLSWLATLRFSGGLYDCLVIDLSLGGAKVRLGEDMALAPADLVGLVIDKIGAFRAETVWRRGNFVGLRFQDPPESIAAAFGSLLPPEN